MQTARFSFTFNKNWIFASGIHTNLILGSRFSFRSNSSFHISVVYYSLHITVCILQFAHCSLHIAVYLLQFAYCRLQFPGCSMQFEVCRLQFEYCSLLIAVCILQFAYCSQHNISVCIFYFAYYSLHIFKKKITRRTTIA